MRSKYSFLFILLLIIVQIIIFYYSSTSIYSSGLTDPVCGCDGSLGYCYRCDEDAVDAYGEVIPCSFFDSNHWCCYYTVWDPDGCNTCTASCGACSSGTYYSTPPDNYYASGSRICRRTNCSTYTQTCYSACPIPLCSDYNQYDPNGLTWQDDDPGTGRSATLSIPVSNPPSGCDTTVEKKCYTTNSQPELDSITVEPYNITMTSLLFSNPRTNLFTEFVGNLLAADPLDEVLGYTSDDHSGTELNNRVKVTATYSDADGVDDIQAVYVWWSPESQIGVEDGESTDYLYPTTETGLRRYYPMDEASGTTVKDVASNTNATASGTTITSGKSNNARSFDGSNDYINTGEDIDYGTGTQITVSAWIKYTTCTGTDGLCYVVSKNQYISGSPYTLFAKSSGSIGFGLRSTTTLSAAGYNDGEWHYIVGVLNGTTAYIYVDGALKNSTTVSPANNDEKIIIGSDDADPTYRPFNGTIDEVSIYNVALTESQILEKYEAGFTQLSSGVVLTPNKIDTDKEPQVDDTSSFGFMITTGDNPVVYVPHITSVDDRVWVPINDISGSYYIYDKVPSSVDNRADDRMIELSNISINNINTNEVQLTALMRFITENNDLVATDQYNLFGMANDLLGFTAYETDGIKDDNIWADSTTNWNLDMEDPTMINYSVSNGETDNTVEVSFYTEDDDMLSYVRVDACANDITNPSAIEGSGGSYGLQSCEVTGDFMDIILMKDDANSTYPDLLNSESTILTTNSLDYVTTPLSVNLGTNDKGSITFYITAMDYSGNYIQRSVTYKLGDWIIVEDGLVFGNTGVSSPTKNLNEGNSWATTISNIADYGFSVEDDYLDLTDQVLLGGEINAVGFLGDLVHSSNSENNSFKASGFPGVSITNVYSELMSAYELKKLKDSELFESYNNPDLTIENPCTGSAEYCVISSNVDITIPSDFICKNKTLITSVENINITPDFINEASSDACILLANGNINIETGLSSLEEVHYDVIQALLIAGNNIIIEEDPSNDGLIVEGGLIAFGSEDNDISNIIDNRTISWGYRNGYPVIAVNNSAKYGLMSENIFGSQVEIFKLEIGFKPY